MPLEGDTFYRARADILADMLAELQAAIPDVYVGDDGTIKIIYTVQSGQLENLYLANQLLGQDLFIHTANLAALQQYGVEYEEPMHLGTFSVGSLRFQGEGGTYISIGTEAAYDPGSDLDPVFFVTTADGTIPDTGIASPPTVAIHVAAGNLNGTYEYMVTFVTAEGETLPSTASSTVNPVSQQVDLSAIPVGGPGTTKRRIYRDKNGAGNFRRIAEIADNTTTTYTDNITDAAHDSGTVVPTVDTAHQITLAAQSRETGLEMNVAVGAVTELTDAPAELTDVTNAVAFTGGTGIEDIEDYRQRLLRRVRSPQNGAPDDLVDWATEVNGVESATVFPNLNGTTAAPGEVTVRISGPGGSIPTSDVIAAAQASIDSRGLAQVIYHVMTFTALATNVAVTITPSGTYTVSDVTPAVQAAISDYINGLDVGETLRTAGIIDAVFGLPGVDDVVVTTPTGNLTTASSTKRTPGTITVS